MGQQLTQPEEIEVVLSTLDPTERIALLHVSHRIDTVAWRGCSPSPYRAAYLKAHPPLVKFPVEPLPIAR